MALHLTVWGARFEKRQGYSQLYGPYCVKCGQSLMYGDSRSEPDEQEKTEYRWVCTFGCQKEYKLPFDLDNILSRATMIYEANERLQIEPVNLDYPPTKLQARADDKRYFIGVHLTHTDNKLAAVVYVGEKVKPQTKQDYSQIFVDLAKKQLRYDTTNKDPNELLSIFSATFRDGTTHTVEKKEEAKK